MKAPVRSSRRVHAGALLALDLEEVEEPGGVQVLREVVRHPGAVAVLPVQADGRVVLVRQYRHPVGELLWEIPAGRLERDEDPAHAARRELEEEAGLAAAGLQPLAAFFTSPGFCDEYLHLFRATALTPVPARPEPDERIEARAFTLGELEQIEGQAGLRDAKTLLALLLEKQRVGRPR